MPLTVLPNADVRELLMSLKRDDILQLQHNLAEALHEYSTGDTNCLCASSYQPQRSVIKREGVTTLFMPASTTDGVGMKIVSLEASEASSKSLGKPTTTPSISSVTSDMSGHTLSTASTMSSTTSSVSGSSFQAPSSVASLASTTPRGAVTILDSTGSPKGIINAEELTAFRTALAATFMINKRQNVNTITVFGAGKQAFWHIRLALLLRPNDIKHINIINRSFDRAIRLMKSFQVNSGEAQDQWRSDIKFSALSPEFGEYGRLLKEQVRKADAIFCTTPSTTPLFPAEFLTSHEGRRKGRYIAAIGSYAPHMVEIHPDVFKQAVSPEHHHHHHKHAKKGGVIIVDSLESCLKEAGEVIQAQLRPEHLVEVGELIMVNKAALKEVELGGEGERGLVEWLTRGNVIYKSVGLGLMDLTVGSNLITLAQERGYGTTIAEF